MTWAPDYLTLPVGKAYLRVTDTGDDTEISGAISAISRLINKKCNRQFGALTAPAPRTYRRLPLYNPTTGLWELDIDDVQTTTGMLVNGVAFASSGAVLLPDEAPMNNQPWTRIGLPAWPVPSYPGGPSVNTVTAQFGWTAVPDVVPMAAKLQLGRLNFRRDAPQGVAGSPDQGSEIRMLARLDPDVVVLLSAVRRRRKAA